ncbi:MAG: 30S ribosomal protein S16 [Acidobacteriota bacterium]|nr:MAG: 30S ribosomal protein S16 [Acidobacteriota bacterium]
MLKLRLKRTGTKKRPAYRVVVVEARSKRDGRSVEEVGFYNPRTNPPTIHLQMERIEHWLGCGARTSDTVRGLIANVRNRARIPVTESMVMDESSFEETSASDSPLHAEDLPDSSPAAPAVEPDIGAESPGPGAGESADKSEAPSSSPEEAPAPESLEPTTQEEKPADPTE